jgi:hypothetical protein
LKKALKSLAVLYPKMLHVTCCVHALHRVAEFVRSKFSDVNDAIKSVKSVFVEANSRRATFRELYPTLPLPPEPF